MLIAYTLVLKLKLCPLVNNQILYYKINKKWEKK